MATSVSYLKAERKSLLSSRLYGEKITKKSNVASSVNSTNRIVFNFDVSLKRFRSETKRMGKIKIKALSLLAIPMPVTSDDNKYNLRLCGWSTRWKLIKMLVKKISTNKLSVVPKWAN